MNFSNYKDYIFNLALYCFIILYFSGICKTNFYFDVFVILLIIYNIFVSYKRNFSWSLYYKLIQNCRPIKLYFYFWILLCSYVTASLLNPTAKYNINFGYFEFFNHLNYLPTTLDSKTTILSFSRFLLLHAYFFTSLPTFLNEYDNQLTLRGERLPIIFNSTFYSLILICLLCLLSRIFPSDKLLWLFEKNVFVSNLQQIGPFGYKGNAAACINILVSILIRTNSLCHGHFVCC